LKTFWMRGKTFHSWIEGKGGKKGGNPKNKMDMGVQFELAREGDAGRAERGIR